MASGLSVLARKLWRQLSFKVWPVDSNLQINHPILSAQQITQLAGELAHLASKSSLNALNSEALKQGEQAVVLWARV